MCPLTAGEPGGLAAAESEGEAFVRRRCRGRFDPLRGVEGGAKGGQSPFGGRFLGGVVVEAEQGALPKFLKQRGIRDAAGEEAKVVGLDGNADLIGGEVAPGGALVVVDDLGGGDEDGGPTADPTPPAEVEILDVGGGEALAHATASP